MLWLLRQVVVLAEAALLAPERYPRFTLVGQAVGSMRLGLAALRQLVPEACPVLHCISGGLSILAIFWKSAMTP